jgi:predicted nucleotidyltransferase
MNLNGVFENYEQIAFAYLFGSVATGEQTALSDIDIAIYLRQGAHFSFDDTLQFQGDCCRILKRNDVDVLVLNKTRNLILLEDVIRKGKIIYNTDQNLIDDFELKTLHLVCDFKYQRQRELGI